MTKNAETVARKLGRPRAVDSVDTRVRLLAAARTCFGQNGFEKTTNAQIAEVAGITSGAIYHYFPSKVELYAAVFEGVQDFIYSEFEYAINEHDTLVERFNSILDISVRINRDDPSIAGFVVDVASEVQRNPELRSVTSLLRRRTGAFLEKLCDDAEQNNEIRPGVSRESLRDLLNALLAGLLRFSTLINDSARHGAAVEVLKLMLRNAVFASGPYVVRPRSGSSESQLAV
ncbi:TetR/AcrR family transcriptional regulator [bacterium]|nr:TetR/AcrR family transcriptional regulator [bacterium]